MIAHWKKLGNTSVNSLRESFLLRNGKLSETEQYWQLQVEGRAWDVLLNYLPWGYSIISLPWMKKRIQVEWK